MTVAVLVLLGAAVGLWVFIWATNQPDDAFEWWND